MQLMTQAEFASHRGVSRPAVSNWKKAGLLILAEGPGGKPLVDVARTEARLNARIDPGRGRPTVAPAPAASPIASASPVPTELALAPAAANDTDLATERREHVREQRYGQALKNAQMAGELVPLVEAERRVSEIGRAARERLHAWLRSMAERLAAEKDARAIMTLGEEGIDQVFRELADAAGSGAFGEPEDELTAEEVAELEAAAADEAA